MAMRLICGWVVQYGCSKEKVKVPTEEEDDCASQGMLFDSSSGLLSGFWKRTSESFG